MNNLKKVFIKGTVMFLITVPFLFGGNVNGQEISKLTLKNVDHNKFSLSNIKIPAFAGMTMSGISVFAPLRGLRPKGSLRGITNNVIDEMTQRVPASLTPFARKIDSVINETATLTTLAHKHDVAMQFNDETAALNLSYETLKQVQGDNYFMDTLNTDSAMTIIKKKDVIDKKFLMKKSPTKAVIFSALVPGAGQFYNESYWKIPIIGGLIGYFGYEYFRNNNLYKDYRDQYSASQTDSNQFGDLNLKTLREFYRDQRNDFVWYFFIVYVVNMIDAYVDAHLFDFDVRDEKYRGMGNGGKEYRLKMNLKF